jgi:hypothetical protein
MERIADRKHKKKKKDKQKERNSKGFNYIYLHLICKLVPYPGIYNSYEGK